MQYINMQSFESSVSHDLSEITLMVIWYSRNIYYYQC